MKKKPVFCKSQKHSGKWRIVGCHHFLLFPRNVFKRLHSQDRLNSRFYDKDLRAINTYHKKKPDEIRSQKKYGYNVFDLHKLYVSYVLWRDNSDFANT